MDSAGRSNEIFINAWDAMSRACKGYERHVAGLFDVSWSGQPVGFFNMALTTRSPDSPAAFEADLRGLVSWAAERKQPWILSVCHETIGTMLPEAEASLAAAGFGAMMPLTGMEAMTLHPAARACPECVSLTEAHEGVGSKALRINEAGYQMVFAEPDTLDMELPGWWRAPDRMVTLLESGGAPVSCAAVLDVDGLRYVALVATHPTAQRKGYAEAAMRDVLQRSRASGLGPGTYLHASAAGRPVYERMGYTPTANYTIYALGASH